MIDRLIIISNCTTVVIAEWEARLMIVHRCVEFVVWENWANVRRMSEKLRHV